MHDPEDERFIGEPIVPQPGSFDASMMARGGPGIPRHFAWRGKTHEVLGLIDTWTSREPGKGMDKGYTYIRKHFYRVKTTTGEIMTLEFDRKPQGSRGRRRWSLFSLETPLRTES
ncbi:MAG: cytoplasmic protein [Armatimonadetes bacterium]|nr:cytoplasmic protein [Armatimonadota bacterium]